MKKILAIALSGLMMASLYDPTPVSAQHRVPHAPQTKAYNKHRRSSDGNAGAVAAIAIMGALIAGAAIAGSQNREERVYYDDYGRPIRRPAPRYRSYDDEVQYNAPRAQYRQPRYVQEPQYRAAPRRPQTGASPNFDLQPQPRRDGGYRQAPQRDYRPAPRQDYSRQQDYSRPRDPRQVPGAPPWESNQVTGVGSP